MTSEVRLSREMRLLDVTMIGVGAMIGAGIFVLTGIAAGVAGPALIVVFLLNGFVALLTAAAYAELGSAIHGAGGGYLWIKASLPDPSGFLAGWMDWFAHAVACSLYALGFGAYFTEVLHFVGLPSLDTPIFRQEIWLAVLACTLFAVINYRGASEAGKAGNMVTIGKVAIIGVFIAAGLMVMVNRPGWQGSFDPFFANGWGGVFGAMGLTFIAFEGYEIIAQTSEEVEDPKKNIPRAVFISLLIVIPIYLLVALVAVGAVVPPPGIAVTDYLAQGGETALVGAADQFFVGGAILILVGGLLSTVSALNATIYSSSRVAFAMARDASLPQIVARVHPFRGTPHYAILFSTLLIIGMAIALPIEDVAAAASVMFLLLFGGVNIALIRLRKLRPDLDRGYRVPFVPFTPIVAIATMLFIAVFMFVGYPLAWLAAGGWIVAGFVFYHAYSRSREQAYTERVGWMERLERKQYRVLVAIANPGALENLMSVAVAVAAKHSGDIVLTSVVEVPEGESLFGGRRRTRELEPLLEQSVQFAEARGVSATSVVSIGRRASESLVQTAREKACNLLILGAPSGGTFMERLVSSIGDRVLQRAPCQVAVVYGSKTKRPVKSVVVPVTAGMNSRLASELTPAMSEGVGGAARFITIVPDDVDDATARKATDLALETMQASGLAGEMEILKGPDAGRGLISAIRSDELVLVGAPSSGPISPLFGETVPGLLAQRSEGPVVIVRDVEPRHTRRFRNFFE